MSDSDSGTLQVLPPLDNWLRLADGATPQIWLPDDGPSARILSVGGSEVRKDPRAAFGAEGADVVLPQTDATQVVVETRNVDATSTVTVRMTPRINGPFEQTTLTKTTIVSEDPLVIHWSGDVAVNPGYAALQVRVVRK